MMEKMLMEMMKMAYKDKKLATRKRKIRRRRTREVQNEKVYISWAGQTPLRYRNDFGHDK